MSSWFYAIDKVRNGPISAEELSELASRGVIHGETLIWKAGLKDWIPARQVRGLSFVCSKAIIPPPPVKAIPPKVRTESPAEFNAFRQPVHGASRGTSSQFNKPHNTLWDHYFFWLNSSDRGYSGFASGVIVLFVLYGYFNWGKIREEISTAFNSVTGARPVQPSDNAGSTTTSRNVFPVAPSYSSEGFSVPSMTSANERDIEPTPTMPSHGTNRGDSSQSNTQPSGGQMAPKEATYIEMTPKVTERVVPRSRIQFSAVAKDGNGIALSPQPQIEWSSGSGSIDGSGSLVVPDCNGCAFHVYARVRTSRGVVTTSVNVEVKFK